MTNKEANLQLSTYEDSFAKYYDILTSHKNYPREIEMLQAYVQGDMGSGPKKILDVGCGTGIHARGLGACGHLVTALDVSSDMIDIARSRPSDVRFLALGLAELEERDFDVALSLFNVINCLNSLRELEDFFAAVAFRLKSGGEYLFECWNAIAVIAAPAETVERTYLMDGRRFVRVVTPRHDLFRQRLQLTYDIRIFADGVAERNGIGEPEEQFSSVHNLMLFTPVEILFCLERAGFTDARFHSALPDLKSAVEGDRMLAVTCRRR